MHSGKQKEIFRDLLEYIEYLSEKEHDVLISTVEIGASIEYKNVFGCESVSGALITGVERSLAYSGIMQDADIKRQFDDVVQRANRNVRI